VETQGKGAAVLAKDEGTAVWALGDRYEFKATGEDTGGAFATWVETVPPGGGPPPHIHRTNEESFYVLEGELEFVAGDRTARASVGTFVHVPEGTLHTFDNVGQAPARMVITVAPAGFERFFFEIGEPARGRGLPPPPEGPPDMARLVEIARRHGMEIRQPPGQPPGR
jgi:quercetin dioxygenase-like cupin family protein